MARKDNPANADYYFSAFYFILNSSCQVIAPRERALACFGVSQVKQEMQIHTVQLTELRLFLRLDEDWVIPVKIYSSPGWTGF